jgi:hypothetical protein
MRQGEPGRSADAVLLALGDEVADELAEPPPPRPVTPGAEALVITDPDDGPVDGPVDRTGVCVEPVHEVTRETAVAPTAPARVSRRMRRRSNRSIRSGVFGSPFAGPDSELFGRAFRSTSRFRRSRSDAQGDGARRLSPQLCGACPPEV